jgi:hypothetical protein
VGPPGCPVHTGHVLFDVRCTSMGVPDILGKLVSPIICVGQFNHQNYLGTRCNPNSLSVTLAFEASLHAPFVCRTVLSLVRSYYTLDFVRYRN